MANISVRSQNGGQSLAHRSEWDPTGWARELLRWDPFREMVPSIGPDVAGFAAVFEVKETRDGFVFKADVPGVQEKNLDVTRTGNRLTVTGKRESEKEEKGETWYAMERSYGSFTRAFTLPEGVDGDHIRAELKDGVLTIVVPKKPEAQPQKIALQPNEKKS
jgi:HSP20 family protein